MIFFTIGTLLPAGLLLLGSAFGGWPAVAALTYITVFIWLLDRLVHRGAVQMRDGAEFPGGDGLLVTLALLHLPLMGCAVWAVGMPGLDLWEKAGLVIGHGLFFGQVGHPVAHELIHRGARWKRALGRMVYVLILMGHHASSHLRVHHIHVGLAGDPASAPRGLGFWRYARRAWVGSFRAGWQAETALRARGTGRGLHPYAVHIGGAVAVMAAAGLLAGLGGVLALLAMAAYAQVQILLSDYVQHYGLRRSLRPDGRAEPVGPGHSWNAPHFGSSAMMLNAPRHSDHHVNPRRPYPALRLDQDMPVLPYSVPVMAVIALYPRLWRRVMDPRLDGLSAARDEGAEGASPLA